VNFVATISIKNAEPVQKSAFFQCDVKIKSNMNVYQAINYELTAGFNTGENLPLKRNIIIAVSLCTLTLLLEFMVMIQSTFGCKYSDPLL